MKKFLIGVGNVYYYDKNENLLFQSKTMSTSGLEVAVSNTEISGGYSNVLQLNLIHSPRLNLTLTDTQWNLAYIAANVGSAITTGNNVWTEETVALTAGAGSVLGTPIVSPDGSSTIYGWVTNSEGTTERVAFSDKAFTTTVATSGNVCVRYYNADAASRRVQINSNFVPTVGRVVIDTQLAQSESDVASGIVVGRVQFEVPRGQLGGSQNIEMSSDGFSPSNLTVSAVAYDAGGSCTTGSYLATITEIIDSANWYDNVLYLALSDSDIDLTVGGADQTLAVWAVPSVGSAFTAPNADLDFTSSETGVATVGIHTGVVHAVAAGSAVITVAITAKPTVQCAAAVTVTT
jgi:hypothetical protein